jgi:hypothetical protein
MSEGGTTWDQVGMLMKRAMLLLGLWLSDMQAKK